MNALWRAHRARRITSVFGGSWAGLIFDDVADDGAIERVANVLLFFFLLLFPLSVSHEEVEAREGKHRGTDDGDDDGYGSAVD